LGKASTEFSGEDKCLNESVIPLISAAAKIDVKSIRQDTSWRVELSEEVVMSEDNRTREERGGLEFRSGRASEKKF
jgi:hypothetical protein